MSPSLLMTGDECRHRDARGDAAAGARSRDHRARSSSRRGGVSLED